MNRSFSLPFREACALVREGNTDHVFAVLDDNRFWQSLREEEQLTRPDKSEEAVAKTVHHQVTYLHAWIDCQEESWEAASQRLQMFDGEGPQLFERTLVFTPRRRRPAIWWLLGNLARDLGCLADSIEHYGHALALLNERRMNVPWLHVQVLCDQARVFCRNASRFAALAAYETALQECQNLKPEDQHLRIKTLIGLCELLSQQVDSQVQAREYGQQALELCLPAAPALREQRATLLFLLAGMKEGEDAVKSYQLALTMAEKPELRGRCLLRLAQLALDAAQMEQAKTCCRQALSFEGLPSECQGDLFQVMSRIHVHAGCWEEAISWALKAAEVWPTPETLLALGQLLEVILEDDGQAAQWPIWRQAYRRVITH